MYYFSPSITLIIIIVSSPFADYTNSIYVYKVSGHVFTGPHGIILRQLYTKKITFHPLSISSTYIPLNKLISS